MKKKERRLIFSRVRKKGIRNLFIVIFLFFVFGIAEAQIPGFKNGNLNDLLNSYQISNFKSGLLCSGERNDTIFAIFYIVKLNDLLCVPIGKLTSCDSFVFKDEESSVFRRLRSTNGILTSKKESSYYLKREQILVIKQILAQHISLSKGEDFLSTIYQRIIHYSTKRGIYHIEYMEEPHIQDLYFKWPYKAGDFLF